MLTLLSGAREKCMHALIFIGTRGSRGAAEAGRVAWGQARRHQAGAGLPVRAPDGFGGRSRAA